MLDYTKIESRLKSFLKNNKRLSFSVALLVTFLINGDFSYTDEALKVPVVTRQELQDKIIAEQDNVAQLIKDTERNENEIELKIKKLTQRAEFWVKPLDKSYQLFFIADWGKFSRNRSNTASNFKGAEYSNEVGQENGYGQYANGKYLGMYGIVKNPIEFVDKIDFGANITPKSVPEKTIVEKSVSKKVITPPTVVPPEITVGTVKLATVSPLQIGTMRAPNQPTVNVSAPGTMPSLGAITVSPVAALNINPNPPTVGEAPTVEAPTVQPPATPAGFTPRLITPPEVSVPQAPNIDTPSSLSYPGVGANPGSEKYSYWNLNPSGANDGNISQTSVESGEILKKYKRITDRGSYSADVESKISLKNYTKGTNGLLGSSTVTDTTEGTGAPSTATELDDKMQFFMTLLNSPYSYFGEGTKIAVLSPNGNANHKGTVINLETEGVSGKKFIDLKNSGKIDTAVFDKITEYTTLTGLANSNNGQLYHVNKGIVELGGNGTRYIHTTFNGGNNRVNVIENRGKIVSMNYKDNNYATTDNIVYFHSPDSSASGAQHIYVNNSSGIIEMYGEKSVLTLYTASSNQLNQGDVSFINEGNINLYGRSSTAIAINEDAKGLLTAKSSFIVNKAINLYGDESVGLYVLNSGPGVNNTKNQVKFIIGAGNLKDNLTESYKSTNSLVDNSKIQLANSNKDGKDETLTEKAIGIFQDNGNNKTLTVKINQLDLEKYSKESIGVYVQSGKFVADSSVADNNININGGEANIGLYAKGGDIDFKGNLTMGGSKLVKDDKEAPYADNVPGKGNNEGKGNIGIYAASGKTVHYKDGTFKTYNDYGVKNSATNLGKIEAVTEPNKGITRDGTGVYAQGIVKLEGTTDIKLKAGSTGENTGISVNGAGAKVTLKTGKDSNNKLYSQIEIDGKKDDNSITDKGIALSSQGGGVIEANGTVLGEGLKTTVKNGAVAMVSIGAGSKINAKYSTIDYDGNGYAVYTKDGGTIDISNGEIILSGKSTAMEIDKSVGTNPVTFTNGNIKVMSNDVIVYNLLNLNTALNISNFATSINNQVGTGITVTPGGTQYNKWKLAAIDGGTINIDATISKTDVAGTNGDYFFKKFLGQRLKLNVNENVTANLTSAEADADYNGQVVGIEANSSKKAVSNAETQVKIATGKKIEAARTDGTDKGATGVFINYGQLENKGIISVEKDTVANSGAVGVYAVNGSDVKNEGNINVGGKQSVGILALAYREDPDTGTSLGAEFGTGATNQGKINVTNTSNIIMSDDDAIGIYAKNNNSSTATDDYKVTNAGTIEVKKSDSKTAIGIYADKAKVLPKDGTIKIGEKAVGIYAKDSFVGATGDNLGNIDFAGEKGVGIYLKDASTLLGNKVTLKQTTAGTLKGKVGILADSLTNKTLTTEVVADTGVNDVIAYYSKGNGTLTVQADISLNKNSTGISGENTENLVYSGSKTMKLGEGSTGIFGQKDIKFASGSNIELNGNSTVGVFAKGTSGVINSEGTIKFTKENSIGLYGSAGATVNDKTALMDFSSGTAKNNIGVYLAGAKWIDTRTAAYTFNSDHEKNNIYLFAQGANDGTNDLGSTATLNNDFNVAPGGTASSTNKTIGMYFDTAVKGKTTFIDNTLDMTNGKVVVTNKGIGIYAKNGSTDKNNIINKIAISSTGDSTVGLFTDGNLKLNGTGGKVEALNQGIGLYGNKGKITVTNTHKVEVTSAGTGMYLTGESYLDGGKLELENKTTGITAAAIYYKKGTSSNEVNHKTDLTVTAGNDLLALYADGGIKLNNNKDIVIDTGENNVGAYVTGGSIFNNKGSIKLGTATGTNLINAIGVYVADGEATNTAGKTIEIYDRNNVAGSSLSVGMLAKANAGATATATIKNAGNLNVNGEAVGMNIDDNSTGSNSGTITAKENNNLKAIGAYVNGANAKFTNTGTISADNIALALKNTTATKIANSGTLKLTKTGAVGVYADDSIVDFNIAPTVATGADGTVALYATGNTKIKSQITSVTGKSHIGVYAEGNAEFQSGSKVIVGNGIGNDYGIGIYTKAGYNKAITSNVDSTGAETIGLYLGNDTVSSTGSTINHTGTINVGSGIGVFIPQYSKFVAQNTTFNVNGGTAVYLKGGAVDLGATGTATINFTGTGGKGIFQDGGTITTGSGLNIVGSGSFLTLKNADSTINSALTVGTDGIGINGIFDATGKDYTLTLDSPNGHIKLNGNKAKGIIAVAEPSVAPNKVDILNKGTIETISGAETTGIYAKGANVHNQTGAKINIGTKGVAIYTTNDAALTNTSLTNDGEIKLIGDEATGLMAIKANTTKDFVLGKINGTKDKLVGAYFENSVNPVKVKDFNINLGTNAKGLVFKDGKDFTIDATTTNNNITVGNTTGADRGIGIAGLGVNGNVTKTDVIVGKNSLGLYVKDKKLTFDLANGKLESSDTNRSSILAYADGNTSEITLNGGGTLKVGANGIAVGTKGGQVTANATTTIEVDGVKGLGAYVENGGAISNNLDVKVKSAEGIGMYAKGGALTSVAKVSEVKGNKSKAYVFENITNAINIANPLQLNDINATEQVGVVVKGTGAGLTVAGLSVVGNGNTGIYNETSGAVINNGTLTVGDSTGDSSIGIYSKGGAVTSTGNATIGKNSIAIYAKKTGVNFNGDIALDEKAIGLYVENDSTTEGDTNINGNVTVGSNGAIGVQATNSKINLTGDLSVATGDSKGIFSSETGDVITSGNITVADNSVGIYKSGNAEVKTTAGKTITVADNGYGIFAKDGAKVTNNANITVGEDSVGIYVDGNNLTSIADVTVADKGVGLLVKNGGTLTSTGNISLGSNNAVGLYADNSNIIQNGLLNIGANDGIGIYSKGTGNISTVGNITVGNDAIGVYKTGKGLVNISSTMNIGDKGYGAYYVGTSKTDSTLNITGNMTLGKEAVGVYTKNTTVNYNGNITVGETTIGSNGYNNPKVNKNSIGIFGDNSDINYTGNMLVEKPLSVGIYGANGGSITLKSGSTLTAKNGATGIMTGNGVSTITIESGATLNAIGKARDVDPNADTKNATFGISAFSGNIYNYGVINATTGATAIYKDGTAELKNRGTINIDPSSSVLGATPTKANADVGGVNIDISGKTTIGGKLINGGTVNIKGDLAMEGMGLDISTGKTVIDARTISGVAYVEPTFSKGNSEQKITVKDVFRVAPNGIGAFSGDVKSKSVSWIAKITKDPTDTTTATKDITMVKLPYTSLIAGEKYKNLATGLEDVRSKVDVKSESAIFKSLDNIDNHKDFATAVANIRGDIYSNIQERMKTVESAFDRSYDELLSSYNKTRNVDKYSIIHTAGEHEDGTVGVSGYKYKTVGALYVNDREGFTYGGKYGWSAGVVGTDFDFRGDTNKDSKERVISGKLGLHYQTALNKDDDNARLKWLSRGEFTVNRHRTKRYGQIGADTYKHKATFYSTDLSWRNKVYYEYDVNTKWTVTPYAGLDMSYGHIFNIRENGENLGLEVKGKDYFVVTPNVGIETKYVLPVGTVHQLFVKADTRLSYDVVEMYRNPNQAKIREASSGYYDLSEPERRKARMAVGAEIGLEKENIYGLTFRAEYQGYKKSQLNYGVRLNYKF